MTTPLIVELDARTANLDAGLRRTEANLDSFESGVGRADTRLAGFTKVAGVAANGVVAVSKAAVVAATALSTMIVATAKSQQELGILSKQAKLSTADFTALAFATNQYGINAKDISDISKDISDKIGEYSKAGTGAFQDFADVVGLSKEEAVKAAIEFGALSGDQALGRMVSMMEKSGATADQMTFAMESIGSEASRLIPLFANQSAELTKLTSRYTAATKSLNLTKGETADLQETATSFNLAMDTLGKSGAKISSSLAPTLNEFFNGVISVVPDATQTIINFINSFRDEKSIMSIKDVNEQIAMAEENTADLREEQERLNKVIGDYGIVGDSARIRMVQTNVEIKAQEERVAGLIVQKEKLAAQEIADAERLKGGIIGGGSGGTGLILGATGADDTASALAAIEDRFKSEQQLLTEKLNEDLIIIGENNELKLQLQEEYLQNILAMDEAFDQEQLDAKEDLEKKNKKIAYNEQKVTEEEAAKKEEAQRNYMNAATTIAGLIFEDNKAVGVGMATVSTAIGISKALETNNWAAAAAVAASGAAQISAILSAEKGGSGTVSSVSSSAPESSDDGSASISSTDASGNTQNVVISFDASDSDIIAAIAKGLKTESTTGNI